jgi:hypothetical protein
MASKRFKVTTGGHVSIYVPWRPEPIEILEGDTYETGDKAEIEALKGSPEVSEVKDSSKGK